MYTLYKNIVYNSFIIALYSIVYNAVYYDHQKDSGQEPRQPPPGAESENKL